jgi:hypothetical protein
MKAAFSKIGLGALIASAFNVASAAPTATTTQTGAGNTAFVEQALLDPLAPASATIIQVGNNNHAGDPVTQTPGILQRNVDIRASSITAIQQVGNENTASIVQDFGHFAVSAEIQQMGDYNNAFVVQNVVTWLGALLRQEGSHNIAALEQTASGDLTFTGRQNGSDNVMLIRQHDASFATATVTQTGSQNFVYADRDGAGARGGFTIEQTGSLNSVTSAMTGEVYNAIHQSGTGNTATTVQAGAMLNFSDIVQTGDANLATLSQTSPSNRSLMTQTGNGNQAAVTQTSIGPGGGNNTAYITQIGNGFVASLSQAGGGNNGGIYQH